MIEGLHFHHIGVACRNIEKEIQAFAILGYDRDSEIITDPLQGIHCCFLKGPGLRIELLVPTDDTCPVTCPVWFHSLERDGFRRSLQSVHSQGLWPWL